MKDTGKRVKTILEHPRKALVKMAIPIMIAMVVQALYNIVDTAFIGRLGPEYIAALTFSMPLFFLIFALNAAIGSGCGSRMSRSFGAKKIKDAENTGIHGLISSMGIIITFVIIGTIFMDEIFGYFGAGNSVLIHAQEYFSIILLGSPFLVLMFIGGYFFSAQGNSKYPTISQITSFVLNMILDPIFIFVLGWGIKGAAIATVISFIVGAGIITYLLFTRSMIKIKWSSFNYSFKIIKEIFKVGGPSGLTVFMMSLFVMFVNKIMTSFSVKHVALVGISMRIEQLVFLPVIAIALATLNVIGIIYGAKRFDLIKRVTYHSMKFGVLVTVIIGMIFFILPEIIFKIFTSDIELITLAVPFLRFQLIALPVFVIALVSARSMQAMGNGWPTLVVNIMRLLLIAIPLSMILIYVFGFGYLAVPFSMLMGGLGAAIVGFIWFRKTIIRMNAKS